ncbi:microcystin-dependent protein [Aquabacterium commune]|uniref:Microcystin-dependent protein n=1 Tax=Aquabacterium commune TaxID=70586 RepID=A0A4R6R4G6_9BURK|nr:tail fiber protein [Aquabacterium commune]TDP80669.1 microcystin-dependent protein [Aquabacterium commune]
MPEPYVGEIRMFAGNFAPVGWAFCDGSILSIAENEVLFTLIGTTYGGDGQETFALPDLRGRAPIHQGTGPGLSPRLIGQAGGVEQVTLSTAHLPSHRHALNATAAAATAGTGVSGSLLAATATTPLYGSTTGGAPMATVALTPSNGGQQAQAHENRAPYLGMNFIISLFGIFPSPS